MSARATRWLLFAVFALALPFPAVGPFGGFVPAAHHVTLLAATLAIVAVEGIGGPIGGILALFAVHAVATLLLCALAAWLCARLLSSASARTRAWVAGLLCAALLGTAIAFPLYDTPFNRAPTANLFGVFG